MKIIKDNFNEKIQDSTIIILGSFDGIHKGHRALIDGAKKVAKNLEKKYKNHKIKIMVCTFENHPLSVVNKDICPKLIMSNDRKSELFEKLGVDIVNFMNFNKELMEISPEDFIMNLKKYYNAVGIVVGFNNRFGYKNLGDTELLNKFSDILGYNLLVIKPVKVDGEVISSSVIRHHIQEGNIERANKLLATSFMIHGRIVKGKQFGRTMGFPTINIDYDKKYIIPKGGVYSTIVSYNNRLFKGITNIGYNPTVNGDKLSIETHIIDFNQDIYGEEVNIYFIEKIREERKFANIDELRHQLKLDKCFVRSRDKKINV